MRPGQRMAAVGIISLVVALSAGMAAFWRMGGEPNAPANTAVSAASSITAGLEGQLQRSGARVGAELPLVRQHAAMNVALPVGNVITGVVVDMADAPVSAAVITCRRLLDTMQVTGEVVIQEQEVERIAETASRPDGHFSLDVGVVTDVVLETVHPGFAHEQTRVDVTQSRSLRIVLKPAGRIYGRVTEMHSGCPAGAARVSISQIRSIEGNPIAATVVRRDAVSADTTGWYCFSGLAQGTYNVRAMAADGAAARRESVVLAQAGSVECNLVVGTPGPWISGIVVDDADGQPLADARVWSPGLEWQAVVTGGDGRFQLATGSGKLRCVCASYAWHESEAQVGKEDRPLTTTIRLIREATIQGALIAIDGVSLDRAKVFAVSVRSGSSLPCRFRALVQQGGRFSIGGLNPDRSYWLMIKCDGAGQATKYVPSVRGREVTDVGDIEVGAAASVTGRVSNSDSNPMLSHLFLQEVRDDGPEMVGKYPMSVFVREELTTTDGRFLFEDLGPGRYSLRVTSAGAEPRVVEVGPLSWGQATTTDVVFDSAGEVGGVVAGAMAAHELYVGVINEQSGIVTDMLRPTTDADRRFRLSGLAGGTYTVVAEYRGEGERWICGRVRGVALGSLAVEVRCPALKDIRGQVVDAAGTAVTGASVHAKVQLVDGVWYACPAVRTKSDGAFRLAVGEGDVVDIAVNSSKKGSLLVQGVPAGTPSLLCILR